MCYLSPIGLNVNHGQSIFVRLRLPSNPESFLPFEQCLDTLLHELAHIVQGPHDERFHRLWNELRDEWMELQIKGYTGEGFIGQGHQLGGNNIPRDELRRMARNQARQDREHSKKHGNRVGGSRPTNHIRDATAIAAIQRNGISNTSCATGTKAAEKAMEDAMLNGFRSKEEMDEANELAIQEAAFQLMEMEEAIILQKESNLIPPSTSSSTPEPSRSHDGLTWDPQNGLQLALSGIPTEQWESFPLQSPRSESAPPVPYGTRPDVDQYGRPLSRLVLEAEAKKSRKQQAGPDRNKRDRQPSNARQKEQWDCNTCTLINPATSSHCEACDQEKPKQVSVAQPSRVIPVSVPELGGWTCNNCSSWTENQWWTCSYCGCLKVAS
jgi:hypothetical protein